MFFECLSAHHLAEETRFIHFHYIRPNMKPGSQFKKTISANRGCCESVSAHDHAIAGLFFVDLSQQSCIRLPAEPVEPMFPESFRVAGVEDDCAFPGDANALKDEFSLVHVEGRYSILDADNQVKSMVAKRKPYGIHLD